jgi:hypothetical protein
MEFDGGQIAGLLELVLVFSLVIGFGVHQMLDLRRERRKREAAEREQRGG